MCSVMPEHNCCDDIVYVTFMSPCFALCGKLCSIQSENTSFLPPYVWGVVYANLCLLSDTLPWQTKTCCSVVIALIVIGHRGKVFAAHEAQQQLCHIACTMMLLYTYMWACLYALYSCACRYATCYSVMDVPTLGASYVWCPCRIVLTARMRSKRSYVLMWTGCLKTHCVATKVCPACLSLDGMC